MSKRRGATGRGSIYPWRRREPTTGKLRQVGYKGLVDLGPDPDTGKRLRKAVYGRTQQEVVDKLTEELAKHKRGEQPKPGRRTVEEYMQSWLKRVDVKPRSLEHYELVVRKHIVPIIGSKTLAKLTPNDVELLLANRRKAGLSPRSVHHVRAVLRNALRKAVRDRLVPFNAASMADAPEVPMVEMHTFTPEEVRVFLHAVRGRRLEALYVTTLAVGLRQGEGLGLRWSDIDLERGTLRISRALQWIRPQGQPHAVPTLVEPKSRTSRRAVELPAVALEALRAHRKRWVDERLHLGDKWLNEWDLVFVGPMGQPLNPKTVWRDYRDVLKSAGLPLIRYHDLRHSCASLLLLHGVPARMVQEILGHSSISLTLGTYSHVLPGLREQAKAAMDAVLGG
ncbi:MAG: tyrosine-type recombinase/integrase [Thermoplasmata archaeon]